MGEKIRHACILIHYLYRVLQGLAVDSLHAVCVGLMVTCVSMIVASVTGWIIHEEGVMAVSEGKGIQR